MKKIELLSPCGNLEKLKVAVLYGADAVYLGMDNFSLRYSADNFSFEDLKEGLEFAHSRGVKVYVAFNVYPRDDQEEEIKEYLIKLDEYGIDAIIVSSLYVINLCNELNLKFERHVSTQESVSNSKVGDFYKDLGVSRLVLARELNLEEIKETTKNTSLDIEVFIHGAVCSSISGRCTLSNHYTGRDANYGACAHPCRWNYSLYDEDELISNKFLLGSKDLETISYIKDLIEAGVTSLKIEGRMKSINYIAHVVKSYRELIDSIYENKEIDLDYIFEEISQSGNRSFTNGFIKGELNKDDLIYSFINTPLQNYLGMVIDYDESTSLALIDSKNPLIKGESIEVVSYDEDIRKITLNEIYDPDDKLVEAGNNTFYNYKIKVPFKLKKYEILRKSR